MVVKLKPIVPDKVTSLQLPHGCSEAEFRKNMLLDRMTCHDIDQLLARISRRFFAISSFEPFFLKIVVYPPVSEGSAKEEGLVCVRHSRLDHREAEHTLSGAMHYLRTDS